MLKFLIIQSIRQFYPDCCAPLTAILSTITLACKHPRIKWMRDLQKLVAPVLQRPTHPVFRSVVLVAHERAAETIIQPAFEHAVLERVPKRIDHMI